MMMFKAASLLPPKKKYNPAVQMKRIQWTKVAEKVIKGSFWEGIDETEFEEVADLAHIEEAFAAKKSKKIAVNVDAAKKKPETVHVVDAKKVQNLGIIIGGMRNTSPKEMVEWVENMRTDKLVQSFLETMIKNFPDETEIRSLDTVKDDKHLGAEDRLLWDLAQVPRCRARINAMLFTYTAPDQIEEVGPAALVMLGASEELRKSRRLARVMKVILLVGNYMNAGSRNQGSHGFKVDFITKLSNTKTSDNTSTLMHYLARVMVKNYPNDYQFWDELPNVERGQRITTQYLVGELKDVERGLRGIEKEIKWFEENSQKADPYYVTMSKFYAEYCHKVKDINEKIKLMEEKYLSLCSYFVVDAVANQPEELYAKFADFTNQFKAAVEHNKKVDAARKKQEELERKKREKAEQRLKREKSTSKDLDLDGTGEADQRGVMDDLIKSLKSGDAFQHNKRRGRGRRNADGTKGKSKTKTNAQEMLETLNAAEGTEV